MAESSVFAGRPAIADSAYLGRGVASRLYSMFYTHGRRGTALFLPFDQLWEHGPAHQLLGLKEGIADPRRVIDFANQGKFAGLVLHVGMAEKFGLDIRPDLPLIVKVDGHTNVGKEADMPTHAQFCSLERAARAGAAAVGMTYYLGSADNSRDVERISKMVERAHEYGLPVVLWSYPRGPLVNKTQGDSLYWVHHAVKSAEDLGIDICKTKPPVAVSEKTFEAYREWIESTAKKTKPAAKYLDYEPKNEKGELDPTKDLTMEQHIERYKMVINAAPRTFVIFSGGPKIEGNAQEVLEYQTKIIMESGGEGCIYGRNLWGVPTDEGLRLMDVIHNVISQPEYQRPLPKGVGE